MKGLPHAIPFSFFSSSSRVCCTVVLPHTLFFSRPTFHTHKIALFICAKVCPLPCPMTHPQTCTIRRTHPRCCCCRCCCRCTRLSRCFVLCLHLCKICAFVCVLSPNCLPKTLSPSPVAPHHFTPHPKKKDYAHTRTRRRKRIRRHLKTLFCTNVFVLPLSPFFALIVAVGEERHFIRGRDPVGMLHGVEGHFM